LERVADKALVGSGWLGPRVKDTGENIQQFLSLDLPTEVASMIYGKIRPL
jgi:hypothetical protein